ncbi:hypothetical protein GCM10027446_30250 [Angustibacter peucedani]
MGAGLGAGVLVWATGLGPWWLVGPAVAVTVLAVASLRGRPAGPSRAGRGALVGAALALVVNLGLEVADVVEHGGLDSEWVDTVIGWDIPSTLFCACLGAAIGSLWRPRRSQPAPR